MECGARTEPSRLRAPRDRKWWPRVGLIAEHSLDHLPTRNRHEQMYQIGYRGSVTTYTRGMNVPTLPWQRI